MFNILIQVAIFCTKFNYNINALVVLLEYINSTRFYVDYCEKATERSQEVIVARLATIFLVYVCISLVL